MRKTLSLDRDVSELLERVRNDRGTTVKETLNEALRLGLKAMSAAGAKRKRFRTRSVNTGKCLLPNLDNIAEALARVEGENYR